MNNPIASKRLCVVLVNPRNPLNIGAAARAMSNFGFSCLRVVRPYEAAFREARSAVGAAALLAGAEEYSSVAEAVADCSLVVGTTAGRNRDLEQPLRRLEEGARLIRKRMVSGRVALLFGSEKRGLANRDLDHCHWLMRIPTIEQHTSMNLGQAVAVCLYELVREARISPKGATPAALTRGGRSTAKREMREPAVAADEERLTLLLLEALQASGYVKPGVAEATEEKLRRMVRRLNLSANDVTVWLGMMRKIAWKLRPG
ncbi:MAG TPA: RNA methyltransferase [Alphaproteobacteria bacterium]|nr:RNA methyltransferase [Alphaproteobacteria bacterium]